MAQLIEGVFPDGWLPSDEKFLNEHLAQIDGRSPPSDSSGWSDGEDGIFRDQGLEPSSVVKYERLALTRARRRGALVALHQISAQYRAWAADGQLLGQWTTSGSDRPHQTDAP